MHAGRDASMSAECSAIPHVAAIEAISGKSIRRGRLSSRDLGSGSHLYR
jgi:hypothetical protein